jgi:hypothetical protein
MDRLKAHHYLLAIVLVVAGYYGFKHYKATGKLY